MTITYTKIGSAISEQDARVPYCAAMTPPIRESDLAGKFKGKIVRCVLEAGHKKFTPSDFRAVATFLERDNSIVLAVGSPWEKTQFDDLSFLHYFTAHRAFYFALPHLSNVEMLTDLAPRIVSFSIRMPRAKKFKWDFLSACSQLRYLDFLSLPQLLPVLPELRRLEHLAFDQTLAGKSSIELPKSLATLQVTLGSLPDLSFLTAAPKLKLLELWRCRLSSGLNAISELKQLRHLGLRNLKVDDLPSFKDLNKLNSLQLHGLTNIANVSEITELKKLKKLSLGDLPALKRQGFGELQFYRRLKEFRIGLGTSRIAKQLTETILSSCPNASREFGNRCLIGNMNTLSYVSPPAATSSKQPRTKSPPRK